MKQGHSTKSRNTNTKTQKDENTKKQQSNRQAGALKLLTFFRFRSFVLSWFRDGVDPHRPLQ
jgi:hypothetical protein